MPPTIRSDPATTSLDVNEAVQRLAAVLDAWNARTSAHFAILDRLNDLARHVATKRPWTGGGYYAINRRDEVAAIRSNMKWDYFRYQEIVKRSEPVVRSGGEMRETQVVLVNWSIAAGREEEFLSFWRQDKPAPSTPGYLDETLCEAVEQDEPGVKKFVNVARWRSQEDFEKKFGPTPTEKLDFEERVRQRVWLKPV